MVDTTAYLRGEDMIYESTEKLLRTAILEYDKLAGREFLIGCGVGKNIRQSVSFYVLMSIISGIYWGARLINQNLKR